LLSLAVVCSPRLCSSSLRPVESLVPSFSSLSDEVFRSFEAGAGLFGFEKRHASAAGRADDPTSVVPFPRRVELRYPVRREEGQQQNNSVRASCGESLRQTAKFRLRRFGFAASGPLLTIISGLCQPSSSSLSPVRVSLFARCARDRRFSL